MIKIATISQKFKFQKMKRLAAQLKTGIERTDLLKDILLVFPEDPDLFKLAFSRIILLLSQTNQSFLLVITAENYRLVSDQLKESDCLLLTDALRTSDGIYPVVATKLAGGRFHYFVDLDPEPDNWRFFLVNCITAEKKIGFQAAGMEKLYNIHIQNNKIHSYESKYQQISDMLS